MTTSNGFMLSVSVHDSATNCLSDQEWSRGRAQSFALESSAWVPVGAAGPCMLGGGGYGVASTPGGIVLYSGWSTDPEARAESWIMRRGGWERIDTVPPPRRGARVIFDSERKRVVLFGGSNERGVLKETWEFDGVRWIRI